MDNYAAHKPANIRTCLTDNHRFTVHFTPIYASLTNLGEVCSGIVERQVAQVPGAKIRELIDGWNNCYHPFV